MTSNKSFIEISAKCSRRSGKPLESARGFPCESQCACTPRLIRSRSVQGEAPRATALAIHAAIATTYWLIARRIVEQEQLGFQTLMCFPLP